MNRRELVQSGLSAVGAVAVAGFATRSLAAAAPSTKNPATKPSNPYQKLIGSLSECIKTGDACLAFCISQLADGHKEMAECTQTVLEMLAGCEAMKKLANYQSDYAPKMAAVCAKLCKACEEACARHKDHFTHGMHLECKACMEACSACGRECAAIAA